MRLNRRTSITLPILWATVAFAGPTHAAPPPRGGASGVVAHGQQAEPPGDELSPAQEQALADAIRVNVQRLRCDGILAPVNSAQTVTYDFPLRLAPGLPDHAGHNVSAHVDHDPASGKVLDYHGGARTYDGHKGTDLSLWPFPWNKLDAGEAQVVAAAAGTIVAKADVNPADRNCGQSAGGDWNYVALVHADGRITIYGHMRYRSLTEKAVGQAVAKGEYLGTAASSGNSSGPHLHFEVRPSSSSQERIDPYAGPHSQAESLWASQRPYLDSAINRLATHSAPPRGPDPCLPAITSFQDSFTTPCNAYFYAYYRDFQGARPTQVDIYRPDGTVFKSWTYSDETFSRAAFHSWASALGPGEPAGTWRFQATYNGQTYQTFFNVDAPPAVAVTSPNGGEQWDPASAHTVTWADNIGGEVNIQLYHEGALAAVLATNIASDGGYRWTPDPALAPGPGYSLRVTSVINPAVRDESNAPFALELPTLQPELALAKTVDHASPRPGQTLHYLLTVANQGTGAAAEVILSDPLPVGLAPAGPITLDPPGLGTVGPFPDVVTHINLAAGQVLRVTIPVMVDMGLPAGTMITNTATVTGAGHAQASVTVVVDGETGIPRLFLPQLRRQRPN